MTDLETLLERAVDHPADTDVAADVRRGRAALTRRRRHVVAGATCGLVAFGGLTAAVTHDRHQVATPSGTPSDGRLVHTQLFDIPTPPPGWEVLGESSYAVVLHRTGDTAVTVHGPFDEAILVYLEDKSDPVHVGPPIPFDGRSFYEWNYGDGAVSMSVQQPDGDWLRLQYPSSSGLGSDQMRSFLDGVVVNPGTHGITG